MKIAVVCSNGREGSLIVKEAQRRGINVTGIARGENKSGADEFIKKDIFDLTTKDLTGFDAVVDAFGAWTAETVDGIYLAVEKLYKLLAGSKTRLLVVGGAGSLFTEKDKSKCVADAPDFPDIFKPVANVHAKALQVLRESKELNWTYISPAADFQADGEKTGKYILAGEYFTLNDKGESVISYADYAIAMVDEIEKGKHYKERISVLKA